MFSPKYKILLKPLFSPIAGGGGKRFPALYIAFS
jgi:hypothetical protein